MFGTTTLQPYAEYSWRALPKLTITPGLKYAYYRQDLTQFADNGKTVGNLNGAASVNNVAHYNSWLPSLDAHCSCSPSGRCMRSTARARTFRRRACST